MSSVNKSVVHLTMFRNCLKLAIGTGFLYRHNDKDFLVTAWHNLTGRHPETLKPLDPNGALPEYIQVQLPIAGGGVTFRVPFIIKLNDGGQARYLIHPVNAPRVDVAVIPIDLNEPQLANMPGSGADELFKLTLTGPKSGPDSESFPLQNWLVQDDAVVKEWLLRVDVTEDLFMPGYPLNIRDRQFEPVWKRATIASSPSAGWNGEDKFIIDTASHHGMSGAPVLYYSSKGEVRLARRNHWIDGPAIMLVGVYVGRLGSDLQSLGQGLASSDSQLGIVWKCSVIGEIIAGGCFERLPHDIPATPSEIAEACNIYLEGKPSDWIVDLASPRSTLVSLCAQEVVKQLNSRALVDEAEEALVVEATKRSVDGALR